MKLAIAQTNTRACDVADNVLRADKNWQQADVDGADLMVTVEQSISGYPLEDMARNPDVLDASQKGLDYLLEKSKERKSAALVGLAEKGKDGNIYNAVYLLDNGQKIGPIYKQHLPNYDVFDEKRNYSSGGRSEPIEFRGHKLGILICEDIWEEDVVADLVEKGSEVIVSLNSSPFYVGKQHDRINEVMRKRIVQEGNHVPILYANQVGGQDEIVFDGYSTAMNADGSVAMMMPGFEENLGYVDLTFTKNNVAKFENGVVHDIGNPLQEQYQALVLGTCDYIEKSGVRNERAILGMSGGIDSALAAAVAVDALGAKNVALYRLPSAYSSKSSITDADEAARLLGCSIEGINIEEPTESLRKTVRPFFNVNASEASLGIMDENLQARVRGIILMALSNGNGGVLITTGNKSEVSVGFCTLYGDMNGGFNPLKDVEKMSVYALAEWRNENVVRGGLGPEGMVVPQNIIDKKPSAELRPDQVDEESLPPYPVLDDILNRYIVQEQSIRNIMVETGYDSEVIEDVLRKTDIAEFKRRQAPPGIKITKRSFGKGHRVPITRPNIVSMNYSVDKLII